MPEQASIIYNVSQIKDILMPCPHCDRESPFPWDFEPYVGDLLTKAHRCPFCESTDLDQVYKPLRALIQHLNRIATEVPAFKQIRIEFVDGPA